MTVALADPDDGDDLATAADLAEASADEPLAEVTQVRGSRARRNAVSAERERRVLALVLAGMTFDQIAQEVGYATSSGAWRAYKRGLTNTVRPVADEVRAMESARLDRLLLTWWPRALGAGGHDPSPRAADMVLKIMARRAALLGLDAPSAAPDHGATVEVIVNWQRPDPAAQHPPMIVDGDAYVITTLEDTG